MAKKDSKKSSKKSSNKKDSDKKTSKKKSKINEKDKKFIITLISVLVILGAAVLVAYSLGDYPKNSGEKISCPEGSENTDACTMEYEPVCGYDSEGNQIGTFSNDCTACKNQTIASFTEGECSK